MKITHLSTLGLTCLFLGSPLLFAANPADTPANPSYQTRADKPPRADKGFFEKAAKGGMKEVEVSQAALPNLTNSSVRDFAQMMIKDHGSANEELSSLASAKGVMLPASDMKYSEKWSKNVHNADKDYMKEMVDDHQEAVALFKKGTKSDDPEVASFAMKTLPKLEQHLMMAKDLQKSLK